MAMADGKREFKELLLDGSNYLTWADDRQMHLDAMQPSNAIVRTGANVPGLPLHERAKAKILLRRHIHDNLKMEYLEVKEPLDLWTKLKERFAPQKDKLLPKAQNAWANLRFLDFKSVVAYNTAIHCIVAQLRFCGQIVTDIEMIRKTLETFHPTNMVRQQQYLTTNTRSTKRPAGAAAPPEAHANFSDEKKKGSSRGRGRGRRNNQSSRVGKFKRSGHGNDNGNGDGHGKGKPQKGQQGDASNSKHAGEGCFRCGSKKYWSRTCKTEKHLIDMYQEWKKRQNPEAHFTQAPPDAAAMDVDDPTNATNSMHVQSGDDAYDLDDEDLLD
ncbi:hypothetical protein BS78_04G199500 [Paspalum vaginatum]|nr:hypothetical protein BS78_04G199500 [Paspalum vaginatum]